MQSLILNKTLWLKKVPLLCELQGYMDNYCTPYKKLKLIVIFIKITY